VTVRLAGDRGERRGTDRVYPRDTTSPSCWWGTPLGVRDRRGRNWQNQGHRCVSRAGAEGDDARIARGLCIEYRGSGKPYLPVLDAIGRLFRGSEAERTLAVLGKYAPTWLEQLPGVVRAKLHETPQLLLIGATRNRILAEMVDALEALSADRPRVLVLEDLHWSDRATLDLINWLARRRELTQLFLLGTYRPVRAHPLHAVTSELGMHGLAEEMPLELLRDTDVPGI